MDGGIEFVEGSNMYAVLRAKAAQAKNVPFMPNTWPGKRVLPRTIHTLFGFCVRCSGSAIVRNQIFSLFTAHKEDLDAVEWGEPVCPGNRIQFCSIIISIQWQHVIVLHNFRNIFIVRYAMINFHNRESIDSISNFIY